MKCASHLFRCQPSGKNGEFMGRFFRGKHYVAAVDMYVLYVDILLLLRYIDARGRVGIYFCIKKRLRSATILLVGSG